ncbi:(2Fe-2S)-binding protein [Rhabdaerophilum calidifontis]|uniref:(2Fe-2S)-binding protein n=1 Tax=Rhabdaerophilum calidifontis TaxID=2604328 RepID=UPI00123B53EC|nr:(2Fe-2S)-binding protein [Rhabdaerophilum calidifontis]
MVRFTLNGRPQALDVEAEMPLLWALRDEIGLTGTKYGCGQALCGACTVLVDGQPVRACQTPVGDLENRVVATIEGAAGRVAEAVQNAWTGLDVPQCGYCQSGQVLAAIALLSENRSPSDADIDAALAGNLCRCATYHRIRAAVHAAARALA